MKRFFKVVEKDSDGSVKKPRENDSEAEESNEKKEPLKFMTWNANSFLLRVKNNWPDFTNLITTFDPDLIAIQEVRMPAAGAKGASKIQGEIKDDTSAAREEKKDWTHCWSAPSLAGGGDGYLQGTPGYDLEPVHNQLKCTLISDLPPSIKVTISTMFGIFIASKTFKFSTEERFKNTWMALRCTSFVLFCFAVLDQSQILSIDIVGHCHQASNDEILTRALSAPPFGNYHVWWSLADSNHEEIDVSHPDFFSVAKLNGYIPPNKEDCGQPGFTLSERKRFGTILREGKLVDAYRFLHEDKDMERGFSWSGNPVGRYRGKRMRIDYFLVSEKLKERIAACEMRGHGIELEGFYGSDHCPVTLELSPSSNSQNEDPI
ncbi:hypothetical protein JHK86_010738 [Glycine max]|nr:hypothetical protein JHK86_010738 [Glycine max]